MKKPTSSKKLTTLHRLLRVCRVLSQGGHVCLVCWESGITSILLNLNWKMLCPSLEKQELHWNMKIKVRDTGGEQI